MAISDYDAARESDDCVACDGDAERAGRVTAEGKPYLIDVEVARYGFGWTADPWIPPMGRRS